MADRDICHVDQNAASIAARILRAQWLGPAHGLRIAIRPSHRLGMHRLVAVSDTESTVPDDTIQLFRRVLWDGHFEWRIEDA